MTTVSSHAFYRCKGFNGALKLSSSLKIIKESAFEQCEGLVGALTLPDTVYSVEQYAFRRCVNLDGALKLPDNSQFVKLYQESFAYCYKLTSVTIPASVTSLSLDVFKGTLFATVTNNSEKSFSAEKLTEGTTDHYTDAGGTTVDAIGTGVYSRVYGIATAPSNAFIGGTGSSDGLINGMSAYWDNVPDADKYEIQLMRDGVNLGSPVETEGSYYYYYNSYSKTTAEQRIHAIFDAVCANGAGSYSFKVRAHKAATDTWSDYVTATSPWAVAFLTINAAQGKGSADKWTACFSASGSSDIAEITKTYFLATIASYDPEAGTASYAVDGDDLFALTPKPASDYSDELDVQNDAVLLRDSEDAYMPFTAEETIASADTDLYAVWESDFSAAADKLHHHAWNNEITKATFSNDGIVRETCDVCGKENTAQTLAKIQECRLSVTSFVYDGSEKKPGVIVKDSSGKVIAASNYAVAYSNNRNSGEAQATIKFKGDYYEGEETLEFAIAKAPSSISLKGAQTKAYTGATLAYDGGATWGGSSGAVSYGYYSDAACTRAATPRNAGVYYVRATLAADANHAGATSAAVKFTISPAQQSIKAKKSIYTVKYSKKKKRKIAIGFTTPSGAKCTWAKAKSGKVTLAKNGKVTVKKGAKKKTYTLKTTVTVAAKGNYAKTTVKGVVVKVRVK